jgi:integrase
VAEKSSLCLSGRPFSPCELTRTELGSKRIKEALKGTGVAWYGFHAFRRGLGTRLYNNGTPTELVGKILRHGSGSEVTMQNYIDIEDETKAAALQSLPRMSKVK